MSPRQRRVRANGVNRPAISSYHNPVRYNAGQCIALGVTVHDDSHMNTGLYMLSSRLISESLSLK